MELLRWEVPNDGEVITDIMQRAVLRHSFAVVARIVQVPSKEKEGKRKVIYEICATSRSIRGFPGKLRVGGLVPLLALLSLALSLP